MKRHINQFFSLKAAPALIPFFQLSHTSAGKEVTESFGILRAVFDVFKFDTRAPRKVVVVGDGGTPRTAACFAFMTKWDCVSIDPALNLDKWKTACEWSKPERLTIHKAKIEDVVIDCEALPTLLVLPHAHVRITTCLRSLKNAMSLDIVALPCCTPIEERYLDLKHVKEHGLTTFVDPNIWSPKRTIYMWRDMPAQVA